MFISILKEATYVGARLKIISNVVFSRSLARLTIGTWKNDTNWSKWRMEVKY